MEAEFMYLVLQTVWSGAAAANVFVVGQKMDGPVLKLVNIHPVDLTLQPFADFFVGKRPAEKACDFHIAPEFARQWQVISRPASKSKPSTLQTTRLVDRASPPIAP